MKLFRNAIILSAVLVIIAGAFILMNILDKDTVVKNTTEPDDLNDRYVSVFETARDDIEEMTIETADVKYVIKQKDGKFEVTYPEGMNYDGTLVFNTMENVANLTAEKVFDVSEADLAKYGLGKKVPTLSLKMKDGTEKILELGDQVPNQLLAYAKLKGANKVYAIGGDFAASFKTVSKLYYKQRKIYTPKKEDLYEIKLERSGRNAFVLEKQSGDKWNITSPVTGNIKDPKLQTILTYFSTVAATYFVDENCTDLSKYGLDKPSYVAEVKSKTGNMKLILGKEKTAAEEIYAKVENSGDVFVLGLASLDFLDIGLDDLLESFICVPDIKDVTGITVNMDGQTTNCVLQLDPDGNKDKDKFTVNGKDASGKDENGEFYFRAYYKALIGLMFTDLDLDAKPSAGKPEITIEYRLNKSPGTYKVELVPRDANSYYAMLDGVYTGKIVFKRDLDDVEGIRAGYKKLMESIDKK